MEETREAALACFDNLSEEQKDKAWEDFEAMDLDGDGTITLIEYQQFYYGSSYRIPFQQLDTNRDGKLNFQEFKTLFYLLLNSRGTTPLIPTQNQPNSSQSSTRTFGLSEAKLAFIYLKDSRFVLLTCLVLGLGVWYQVSRSSEVVMKAIEDFNSCWAFASAVASVASGLFNG
ncbi:PREDICTED: uncharacterized protein LOC103341776 isoform X2 [Prunus mume]|uniref:Uncharacterized protein LOC103341776 isoform X2 n=1 Tax=Prunus mume TaxID=102107 RepID=A0ABM0PRW6_PRUMU|nr:PREDICTED: uncharacterized protein LOC103341776 isoform X2 [Prunus mume]